MNNPVFARLPRHFAGFNAFLDGESFFGVIEEGTLPKFKTKADDFQAGTGVAPVEVGLDLEKMTTDFTIAEPSDIILTRFDQRCLLEFRGSQFISDGVEEWFTITQTGLLNEVDLNGLKKGDRNGKTKFTHSVDVITVESQSYGELIHIDNINGIKRIGGQDLTAIRRWNLGVS